LQSRLAKQAFQVKKIAIKEEKKVKDVVAIPVAIPPSKAGISRNFCVSFFQILHLLRSGLVAIPPSKAGISRPSWKPLCAMGNFVKKL